MYRRYRGCFQSFTTDIMAVVVNVEMIAAYLARFEVEIAIWLPIANGIYPFLFHSGIFG